MKRRHILFLLVSLVLVVGLRLWTIESAIAQNNTLLVGAAASLQDALEEIDPIFERANPGTRINYTFAASGPLQQQIEQGAPIDVFLSAAIRQMDALQQRNLILPDTRRTLLTNRLVLVVPGNSRLRISSFSDLNSGAVRRIAIGEPRSVPVGQYTEETLRNLGILEQVRPKFVLGNSVRNVLAAVESANADAGIVYTTDARISDRVRVVATAPENLHSPIVYPGAVVRASRNASAARRYLAFLQTQAARAVFERYGFGIARTTTPR